MALIILAQLCNMIALLYESIGAKILVKMCSFIGMTLRAKIKD